MAKKKISAVKAGPGTIADAQNFINMQMQRKMKACQDEINAALDKYGFILDALMIIRANSVEPQIRLIPKPAMKAKNN